MVGKSDKSDKSEPQIYKLQRPITTNGSLWDILVYNQDRSIQRTMNFGHEYMNKVFGQRFKVYVSGYFDNKETFHINQFLPDQSW